MTSTFFGCDRSLLLTPSPAGLSLNWARIVLLLCLAFDVRGCGGFDGVYGIAAGAPPKLFIAIPAVHPSLVFTLIANQQLRFVFEDRFFTRATEPLRILTDIPINMPGRFLFLAERANMLSHF